MRVCVCVCSAVSDSVIPWTVALQAPLSMGFSREDYWSGLPFPLPGDLPDPGIEHMSPVDPALQVDSLSLSHLGSPYEVLLLPHLKSNPVRPIACPNLPI